MLRNWSYQKEKKGVGTAALFLFAEWTGPPTAIQQSCLRTKQTCDRPFICTKQTVKLLCFKLNFVKVSLHKTKPPRRYHFWPQTTAFRLLAPIHSSVTCTVQVTYASFLIICRCKSDCQLLSCCINPATCCKLPVPFLCICWMADLKMSKWPLSPSCIYWFIYCCQKLV